MLSRLLPALILLALTLAYLRPEGAPAQALPPGVQRVQVGDIEVGYRVLGKGEPLVLITGFAATQDLWDQTFLNVLAARYRVIVFDNRGIGSTTTGSAPFSIVQFAEDTAGLMRALGLDRAHVLGWSMGTYIAQELALRYPQMVDRLVLYAADCGGGEAIQPSAQVLQQLTDTSGTPEQRGQRLIALLFPPQWLAANAATVAQAFSQVRESPAPASVARQGEAIGTWAGACERLSQVQALTLLVTGAADVIVPPQNSRLLAARIANAWLAQFPDGGHGLMYQFPAQLGAVVLAFLQA